MIAAEISRDNAVAVLSAAMDRLIDIAEKHDGVTLNQIVKTMEPAFAAAKKREAAPPDIRNIVVVRLDDIGDNILMSGFLRELRRGFPTSRITLVVNETVYNLVEHCPYVNEILPTATAMNVIYSQWLRHIKKFCAENFWPKDIDLCLMPRWDLEIQGGDIVGYLTGARLRAAYSEKVWKAKIEKREGFDKLLTKIVFHSPFANHEVERNFFFLEEIGVPVVRRNMELWLTKNDYRQAEHLLNQHDAAGKILIAVTVGGSHPSKAYPKEQFLTALSEIYEQQLLFVFLGDEKDAANAGWLTERLPAGAAINLCGQTTVREACAVINFCSMYIGGDTGLKHAAAAQGKPVVEINREARDKYFVLPASARCFAAWQVPSVICQPEHPIGNCLNTTMCMADEAHCIREVKPQAIVDGYRRLRNRQVSSFPGQENWQPNLAEYIPPAAKKILELGAKNPKHSQNFSAINPAAVYMAVAKDEQTAMRAVSGSSAIPAAAVFATFNPQILKDNGNVFDCIIIHDDWLRDSQENQPAQKLAAIIDNLLAENGTLLYYVVNPACFRIAFEKLRGRPTPFADNRNLDEIKALFQAAGIELDCLFPKRVAEDEEYAALPPMKTLFAAANDLCTGELLQKFTPDMNRAYVIRAAKKSRPRLKIHSMIGEIITSRVRLKEPNKYMARSPFIVADDSRNGAGLENGSVFPLRVLIHQRMTSYNIDLTFKEINKIFDAGYLYIGEIDDHPKIWQKDYEASRYIDFVGMHAMQVSTPPLAEIIKNFNPHVYVFQNQLSALPPKRHWSTEDNRPVTVMFAALNRQRDWAPIMPALNAVLEQHSHRITVKVLFDRKFFDALATPNKQYIGTGYPQNFVPYEEYCRQLHTADINLLPLADTEINRVKSDLKFIESAGHGTAVLASPTVYENYVQDGQTGLIYRSPQEFAAKLTWLIDNATLRRQIADNAYQYVKHNRLLCQHCDERLQAYGELFARLPELTKEAWARLSTIMTKNRQ